MFKLPNGRKDEGRKKEKEKTGENEIIKGGGIKDKQKFKIKKRPNRS